MEVQRHTIEQLHKKRKTHPAIVKMKRNTYLLMKKTMKQTDIGASSSEDDS